MPNDHLDVAEYRSLFTVGEVAVISSMVQFAACECLRRTVIAILLDKPA